MNMNDYDALYERTKRHFLLGEGYTAEEISDEMLDGTSLFEGSLLAYTYDLVDNLDVLHGVSDTIRDYFDYKALARDLRLSGDVVPFEFEGQDWVAYGW